MIQHGHQTGENGSGQGSLHNLLANDIAEEEGVDGTDHRTQGSAQQHADNQLKDADSQQKGNQNQNDRRGVGEQKVRQNGREDPTDGPLPGDCQNHRYTTQQKPTDELIALRNDGIQKVNQESQHHHPDNLMADFRECGVLQWKYGEILPGKSHEGQGGDQLLVRASCGKKGNADDIDHDDANGSGNRVVDIGPLPADQPQNHRQKGTAGTGNQEKFHEGQQIKTGRGEQGQKFFNGIQNTASLWVGTKTAAISGGCLNRKVSKD